MNKIHSICLASFHLTIVLIYLVDADSFQFPGKENGKLFFFLFLISELNVVVLKYGISQSDPSEPK